MTENFSTTIIINANSNEVWKILTDPELMIKWIGEGELEIEIQTTWQVTSPILIRGFHHVRFENKGTVLHFNPEKQLTYTHLSSLSRLPDKPENYSILEFILITSEGNTRLTLHISNFPTLTIRKHLEFYWRGTLPKIKEISERKNQLELGDPLR
jgi:uncharacterized protein YndB with AHSA1/START domain